ncbi:gamma-glutamylcyclotransferase [Pseudaminobacter soli (ex Li et al. 2025)]|uniref:glutathione-specific gamma-glutamylcyclotransferase n=1 Tax=Pseudaminobacter soli (ex Li et al. 2025) TaxID=1295366 RepID=A0A2P7RVZ0_9HYPH|nr:gamma-glutamylcyclotransferase [Mesorhizobium soli]PSJ54369.1 gamma-glutamylcyclotransferase [Mesorhizobium soli]
MNLTAELIALVERTEPDPGPAPGTSEHTDAELAEMASALLTEHAPEHLWVFAYGSLIWNPEFDVVEQRRAVASGWHRSFCLELTRWRGTRDLPALMLALDRGVTCIGIAYRLPQGDKHGQIVRLLDREVDANPPTNVPRWIQVSTTEGRLTALAFVALRSGSAYAGKRPLPEVASVLCRAAGHWGSAAQYAFNTITKLEEYGIRDRNLWEIQKLMASEIQSAHPK